MNQGCWLAFTSACCGAVQDTTPPAHRWLLLLLQGCTTLVASF
jgi:hypothetical protein